LDCPRVLGRCSQHGSLFDQQSAIGAFELWDFGGGMVDKEVTLNHLCIFGCILYVHMELDRRSKLDSKSKRCIFIEYGTSEYDYRFWDPEN